MSLTFTNSLTGGIKKYDTKMKLENKRALGKLALTLLNNVVNGSPAEPVVPPILTGLLRGSGSVFVAGDLITTMDGYDNTKANRSYKGKKNEVTIGFNVAYAAKMHEHTGNWGPYSKQSGDVGRKFLEKHLDADKEELLKNYAAFMKSEVKN